MWLELGCITFSLLVFRQLEAQVLDMAQVASQAMAAGLERVREAGEQQQRALLDKVTGRRDLHHQRLSTRLNICGRRQAWSGAGTVTYQVMTNVGLFRQ